jgi:diadenosine tetraphosphate (Ap4A) HIT family hydrolase
MQLGECMKLATEWIYKHFKPVKLYTITISEAVPHLHFHLVPRFEESPKGIEFLQLAQFRVICHQRLKCKRSWSELRHFLRDN